jgi:hypothetical protein
LPKASFTEWLRLDDPASVVAIVDVHEGIVANGDKRNSAHERVSQGAANTQRVVFQTFRKEKTNQQWLENEKARCEKANPTTIYKIVLSQCGQFGCLCKYSKSYARRKNL